MNFLFLSIFAFLFFSQKRKTKKKSISCISCLLSYLLFQSCSKKQKKISQFSARLKKSIATRASLNKKKRNPAKNNFPIHFNQWTDVQMIISSLSISVALLPVPSFFRLLFFQFFPISMYMWIYAKRYLLYIFVKYSVHSSSLYSYISSTWTTVGIYRRNCVILNVRYSHTKKAKEDKREKTLKVDKICNFSFSSFLWFFSLRILLVVVVADYVCDRFFFVPFEGH